MRATGGETRVWLILHHDKHSDDEPFVQDLLLVERAAEDERNFVKKAVNMALGAVGKRNPALNVAAVAVAQRLSDSPEAAARWVGTDALRELTSDDLIDRFAGWRETINQIVETLINPDSRDRFSRTGGRRR